MKFKVKKPFINTETQEQYVAEQIVEMTVARALAAVERLAKYGGGFLEVAEGEPVVTKDNDGVPAPKQPSELTVAELKVELEKLGIDYPSDAKKAELLALFEGNGGEE